MSQRKKWKIVQGKNTIKQLLHFSTTFSSDSFISWGSMIKLRCNGGAEKEV